MAISGAVSCLRCLDIRTAVAREDAGGTPYRLIDPITRGGGGDSLSSDSERARAMRAALSSDVALLADANCRYSVDDVRTMLPVLADGRLFLRDQKEVVCLAVRKR